MVSAFSNNVVRVLVNGLHAKTGGGVTYLKNILPVLAADKELEIHLCLHGSQCSTFEPLDQRIRLHQADFDDNFYKRLIWEQIQLPLMAHRIKAAVTFSPANFGPILAPGPVILLRNALEVSGEEARLSKRIYWRVLSIMTATSLWTCKQAIAVSGYAAEALSRGRLSRAREKITVVHHGASDQLSPPGKKDKREDFLLSVGDIYIQKNLHRLVEAMAHVRDEFPDIRLKVAGRPVDKDYAGLVADLTKRFDLEKNIEILGHVESPELAELYRRCALFVFPSTVETFGNPLVEAMACAAPIVSSNNAAMPEVLAGAALLFDPRKPDQIAERIVEVLKNDDLRNDLSNRSLERSRDFSWRITGEKTAEILKKAVSAV